MMFCLRFRQVIYEERAIEVPEVIHVEAVTQAPRDDGDGRCSEVPRPHVQFIKKEVPKAGNYMIFMPDSW